MVLGICLDLDLLLHLDCDMDLDLLGDLLLHLDRDLDLVLDLVRCLISSTTRHDIHLISPWIIIFCPP